MYAEALARADLKEAGQITDLEGGLFGLDDEQHVQRRLLNEKIQRAFQGVSRGELEEMHPLLDLAKKDAGLSTLLSALILKGLHQAASDMLQRGDPANAVNALALTDLRWRTPTTHSLITTALRDMSVYAKPLPLESGSRQFLVLLSQKDPAVKDAYLAYLERQAWLQLQQGRPDRVPPIVAEVLQIRPDPDPRNDQIRIQQALVLAQQGNRDAARGWLQELQTGLPLGAWTQLFFAGAFMRPWLLLLVLVMLAAGVATGVHVLRRRRELDLEARVHAAARGDDEPEYVNIPLFSHSGAHGLSPKMQEYRGYLRELGLPRDADLKSIKAAYRNAVKGVHPDLSPVQSQADSERFIQLTGVYERLLALRKELGLPD